MIEILENLKNDENSGISDGSIDFETFSFIYMFIDFPRIDFTDEKKEKKKDL